MQNVKANSMSALFGESLNIWINVASLVSTKHCMIMILNFHSELVSAARHEQDEV